MLPPGHSCGSRHPPAAQEEQSLAPLPAALPCKVRLAWALQAAGLGAITHISFPGGCEPLLSPQSGHGTAGCAWGGVSEHLEPLFVLWSSWDIWVWCRENLVNEFFGLLRCLQYTDGKGLISGKTVLESSKTKATFQLGGLFERLSWNLVFSWPSSNKFTKCPEERQCFSSWRLPFQGSHEVSLMPDFPFLWSSERTARIWVSNFHPERPVTSWIMSPVRSF